MRLFAMIASKVLNASKFLLGLNHVSINYPACFITRNYLINSCLLSKVKQVPEVSCENNPIYDSKNKQTTPLVSLMLLKNGEIWRKPIKENEVHTYRETFYEYIKLLGESSKEQEEMSSHHISKIDPHHYEKILRYKNQIFEMALLLKSSPDEAFRAILKHHFLLQSKISTLKHKVDVITEGGIALPDLRKDLWVLSYTVEKLRDRINRIKMLNLPIKTWMLRCRETTLDRTWENREKNKAAMLPFTNTREYLCSRLTMNENQLLSFSRKHPAVLKVKTTKLREVLDYLLSEGFTPTQIYNTPRIFCHSISTIKNRLNMLRDRECEPRTLTLLCMSRKGFEAYIQKLEKSSTQLDS